MKKELGFLVCLLMLMGISGFVMAAEQDVPAQVEVSEFISVTLTPCHNPLDFGSGNPGDENLEPACQNNFTSAISVTNDPLSNKDVDVETKGSDFQNAFSNILGVEEIGFEDTWNPFGTTVLSTAYQTVTTGISPSSSSGVWYFMDIPSGQESGSYTGTLSVRAG